MSKVGLVHGVPTVLAAQLIQPTFRHYFWVNALYLAWMAQVASTGSKANYESDLRVWMRDSAGPDYAACADNFQVLQAWEYVNKEAI